MRKNSTQEIIGCTVGPDTIINPFVNLYGCTIGERCMIGAFVEIQKGVIIGNRVRVQSHSFLCEGVRLEDDVFIGHHVVFINDKYPSVAGAVAKTWKILPVLVKEGASIGSNATILGGITVGRQAVVGAGAVVTRSVPDGSIVVGNPARVVTK